MIIAGSVYVCGDGRVCVVWCGYVHNGVNNNYM